MKKEFLLSLAAVAALTVSAENYRMTPQTAEATKVVETEATVLPGSKEVMVSDNSIVTRGIQVKGDTVVNYYNAQPFYVGYSDKGYAYNNLMSLVPAYSPLLFLADCAKVTSYTWTYANPENVDSTLTSSQRLLSVSYNAFDRVEMPTLEANGMTYSPAEDGRFAFLNVGGGLKNWNLETDATAGTFRIQPYSNLEIAANYYFGNIEMNSDSVSAAALSFSKKFLFEDATEARFGGIAQVVPSVTSPYYFDEVDFRVVAATQIPAGTVAKGTVYSMVTANNQTTYNKIGSFSGKLSESYAKSKTINLVMDATSVDEITGLEAEGIIVPANTKLAFMLDSVGTYGFYPVFAFYNETNSDYCDYQLRVKFVTDKGTAIGLPLWSTTEGEGDDEYGIYAYNLRGFGFNPTFDYVHPSESKINLPKAGGSVSVNVNTFINFNDIYVEEDEDESGVVDGWLKYSVKAGEGEDGVFEPVYTFTAEATETYRETTITIIGGICAEATIKVSQGEDAGVGAVAVEAVAVKSVGGNFEVVVPASVSNVAVYNVAGQKVADVNVTAGANTIDGSALANGVYVLKFNNGYTVKAVK